MTSHEVAKILLEKPNAPLVASSRRTINDKMWMGGSACLREVTSIAYTNSGYFIDKNGEEGDEYHAGRECVEIK